MYNGELLTFVLKDKDELIARSIVDVDIVVNETDFILLDRKTRVAFGYLGDVVGMSMEEFLNILIQAQN